LVLFRAVCQSLFFQEIFIVSGIWGSRDVPWIPAELAEPDGFVGVGGDLSPRTLLRAYAEGVFPWFNEGDPILWWSPDPRGVIELYVDSATHPDSTPGYGGLHISRRLARTIRSGKFRVTVNQCFETVMRACGDCRPEGTWVTDDMLVAYTELHRRGHAHSIETWVPAEDEEHAGKWELAGGTYGLAIGGLFAAESMFYHVTNGSKVALAALVQRLRDRGFALLDVQMTTEHTGRLGATEISRTEYLKRLRRAVGMTGVKFV
jgi:leucyl/phenylalanyl-tRNA--protein transferase